MRKLRCDIGEIIMKINKKYNKNAINFLGFWVWISVICVWNLGNLYVVLIIFIKVILYNLKVFEDFVSGFRVYFVVFCWVFIVKIKGRVARMGSVRSEKFGKIEWEMVGVGVKMRCLKCVRKVFERCKWVKFVMELGDRLIWIGVKLVGKLEENGQKEVKIKG